MTATNWAILAGVLAACSALAGMIIFAALAQGKREDAANNLADSNNIDVISVPHDGCNAA